MTLEIKNVYSFDDNAIINICEIKVPIRCQALIRGKDKLCGKHYDKLNILLQKLKEDSIIPYRFVPSRINMMKAAEELCNHNNFNPLFLADTARIEIIDSFKEFCNNLFSSFEEIQKSQDFSSVKSFFQENEQDLKKSQKAKYTNIPEDDDCMILAGLISYESEGEKFLISLDEHFWRYKDIIKDNYEITVVEGWFCHKLVS